MEYYSALKKNKLLINTTTWMNCKSSALSPRSWAERSCALIPFFSSSRRNKTNLQWEKFKFRFSPSLPVTSGWWRGGELAGKGHKETLG